MWKHPYTAIVEELNVVVTSLKAQIKSLKEEIKEIKMSKDRDFERQREESEYLKRKLEYEREENEMHGRIG